MKSRDDMLWEVRPLADGCDMGVVRKVLGNPRANLHLVGMGGVGMAGLAVLLASEGYQVSGCDQSAGPLADWLKANGLELQIGHAADHIQEGTSAVVRSTAVGAGNSDLQEAVSRSIPVLRRGAVLADYLSLRHAVAVTGTHGKTTTTSMIAQVLRGCGVRTDFFVGGMADALGGVAGAEGGDVIVAEADESDGTIALYEPAVGVITNIEYDHMEHFSYKEAMEECFRRFAVQTKERLVICADDPACVRLAHGMDLTMSYGFSPGAVCRGELRVDEASQMILDVTYEGSALGPVTLPVGGIQNAQNALAACAVALTHGCDFESIRNAFQAYRPVRRRFERVCEGRGVRVISDYAHHPTEIAHVVKQAVRLKRGRVIAVFQPHRYTRTKALGPGFPPAFEGLDELIVTPVYAASEARVQGGTTSDLMHHFGTSSIPRIRSTDSLEEAWLYLKSILQDGDLLLILGAGDIEEIAKWALEEYTE